MEDGKKFTAPYVPFRTFETALDLLASLGGIPPKVDHTIFPSMGGLAKGQVLSAFKFLGLIDRDGVPQQLLKDLALKKEDRKTIMRKILKDRYPNISESDLATMSPSQLDSKLGDAQYNVIGATKTKARSFLLKAAQNAGIPLSLLLTSKGPRGPKRKRASSSARGGIDDSALAPRSESSGNSGHAGSSEQHSIRMPIALGPGRVAHIELPKDWESKELKKLLALLKLSLGEDEDLTD